MSSMQHDDVDKDMILRLLTHSIDGLNAGAVP